MVETVFFALQNEFRRVPRQETQWCARLNVFGVRLVVEFCHRLACGGVVTHHVHIVLRTIHLLHIDGATVGAPSDATEIAVGGVASVQIDDAARSHVVHADSHLVGGLTSHWIFFGSRCSHQVGGVGKFGHID